MLNSIKTNLGKGSKKKNSGIFHYASDPPPPIVEKNKKTKNYLRTMKKILYDMGPCQMASLESFKGLRHPLDQDPRRVPPPNNWTPTHP